MPNDMFPQVTTALAAMRKEQAPEIHEAFEDFSARVFADGALLSKTKQLIAVAVAHVTQCPYCIRGHTRAAVRSGATARTVTRSGSARPAASSCSRCAAPRCTGAGSMPAGTSPPASRC